MVRVVKLFKTFAHKLEIFIVLYQFLIMFYQRIEKVAIIFMLLCLTSKSKQIVTFIFLQ